MAAHEHEDWREQAALFVLDALASEERRQFEAHLAGCAECAAEVRSLTAVPTLLARAVPQVDPRPALRQRVMSSVAGAPRTPGINDEEAMVPAVPPSGLAPWLAMAASFALTVGLGVYAFRLQERIVVLETRLRDALVRADASDRQMADARRAVADAESRVAVLVAPDLARIDLAGQPAAPRAAGRGYWSRSRGLVFTASDLPALPAGRTYQLWVLTAGTAPISNGWVFGPDASGRAAAIFATPVDIPRPTAIAITLEPAGGVPAPTGDKFLVGLAGT